MQNLQNCTWWAGALSLVLFAKFFFDFLNTTSLHFFQPLWLLLLMSFNLHMLSEETNQLPIPILPNLLPDLWVTALNLAAHTSLKHLKPILTQTKLCSSSCHILSLYSGYCYHPGIQLRNLSLLWLHSLPHSAALCPWESHCFWLKHLELSPNFSFSSLHIFHLTLGLCH